MAKRLFATIALGVLCTGTAVLLTISPRATAQVRPQQVLQSPHWQISSVSVNHLAGAARDELAPYPRSYSVLLDTETGETWILQQIEDDDGPFIWSKLQRNAK
jgi:hypothetical protein